MGQGFPDSKNIKEGSKNIKYHIDYMAWLLEHRRWLAGEVMTLADFAAANPTGGEAPVVDAPIPTDAPAPTEAAPSLDDALGAAMDAGETGGASVADAAVPDAGVPADAGIADAPEAAEPAEPIAAPEPDIV